jgi:hypothetical protein
MLFDWLRGVVTHPGVIPPPHCFSDFGDNDDGQGDGRADEPLLDVEVGGLEERLEGDSASDFEDTGAEEGEEAEQAPQR